MVRAGTDIQLDAQNGDQRQFLKHGDNAARLNCVGA